MGGSRSHSEITMEVGGWVGPGLILSEITMEVGGWVQVSL